MIKSDDNKLFQTSLFSIYLFAFVINIDPFFLICDLIIFLLLHFSDFLRPPYNSINRCANLCAATVDGSTAAGNSVEDSTLPSASAPVGCANLRV